VDVDIGDGVSVEGSPLAAGEFDFGKFGHGNEVWRKLPVIFGGPRTKERLKNNQGQFT
jgi:hypothetical protein